jgi:CheY-like chemotaxis protein
VLVIEDAGVLREQVVHHLRNEGFQVYGAANAEQALIALRAAPRPALVLADLMASDIDADVILAAMDHQDRLATLPVVVMTENAKSSRAPRRRKNLIDFRDLLKVVEGLCARRT